MEGSISSIRQATPFRSPCSDAAKTVEQSMNNVRVVFVAAAVVFLFTPAAQAQAPSIAPSGIVNSASLRSSTSPSLAPGSLVSVFGTNLSRLTQTAVGPPYATRIAGSQTQLFFGT